MKYIKYENVKIYYDFKLLFDGFMAIMLFGNIYCCLSKDKLERYLKMTRGKEFVNHEQIHIAQANSFKCKWFKFYPLYVWQWIKNLFKYGFNKKAYYNIPFEKEAYANEGNFNYLNDFPKSNWKMYK